MCEGGRLIHRYLRYTWKGENMDEMIHRIKVWLNW